MIKEESKVLKQTAFIIYWLLFISRVNEFDRLFETLLVDYVEKPANDLFPEIITNVCLYGTPFFKDKREKVNRYKLINCIDDEDEKVKGLSFFIDDENEKTALSYIEEIFKYENIDNIYEKLKRLIEYYKDEKLLINNKILIDNEKIFKTYKEILNIGANEIYNEIKYCACMAKVCYFRRKDRHQYGIDLLSRMPKCFQERIFYKHNDIRFKIEIINNKNEYYDYKYKNDKILKKYKDDANRTLNNKIQKNDIDKYINVGVYIHYALLIIKIIELDINIYNKTNDIKIAKQFLQTAIKAEPEFSSAIGYLGILNYHLEVFNREESENLRNHQNKNTENYFYKARLYLLTAMQKENKRNAHSFKYYNLWQQYYHLSENAIKRDDTNLFLDEKLKIVEKERQQLFGLVTLFVSVITIVVAFVITLNQQDVAYLPCNASTISITTDKIFILFSLFSLVLLTYFLHFIFTNNESKKSSINVKTIVLVTLSLFLIGVLIFIFGRSV